MKKLVIWGALFLVAGSVHIQSAKRLVTLRNNTVNDMSFWVQYAPGAACGDGAVVRLATSGRRQTVEIWSGGDCPLQTINPGSSLNLSGPVARIRDEQGNEAEQWKGKREINFYPTGFFDSQRRLVTLELAQGNDLLTHRTERSEAVLWVEYDQEHSVCPSEEIILNADRPTVRIHARGDCPVKSITGYVVETPVNFGRRGVTDAKPVNISMANDTRTRISI